MGEIILKMQGIQKYFPGVHALDDAQLEIRSGEVMGLIGENGAGKSTLMKILTGVYTRDAGTPSSSMARKWSTRVPRKRKKPVSSSSIRRSTLCLT